MNFNMTKYVKAIDRSKWWEIALTCEYATFFHSPLWHQLATETYPKYRDVTVGIELENGCQAVMPLLETLNIVSSIIPNIMSTFAGCYGGIIADTNLNEGEQKQIYQDVFRRRGRVRITGNPLMSIHPHLSEYDIKKDFTHILFLNSSFDEIYSQFSKGHRSSYKKGIRMGVTVREASSMEDYKSYFKAYEDSLRRWGEHATSRYPWALFENGYHLSKEYPDHIKLWLALVDDRIIAGAWVFYWNHHVDWWHGAAYEAYFDHYPNNVLQTVIIKDALENGYKYYDFNPSGGHQNVARFKKRFGAKQMPIRRWKYEDRKFEFLRKLRGAIRGS